MIRLRPYKSSDADYVIQWVNEERLFTMWCANRFTYPLTEQQLREYQENMNREETGWIFTALDETGRPVGHICMRAADYEKQSIHFGFVVIDPAFRGRGYGKEMVNLAIKYAFEILKVKRATLKVFDCNPTAHHCYQTCGFQEERYVKEHFPFHEEKWGCYDMAISAD